MNPNRSHKIVGIAAILWNIFGVLSFISHTFISEQAWAGLNADQTAFMESTPMWSHIVFGIATLSGLAGAIGLLMRKKWCVPVLLISLITILINQLYPILFTDFMALFGGVSTLVLPMIIIAIAAVLYWYARKLDTAGRLS